MECRQTRDLSVGVWNNFLDGHCTDGQAKYNCIAVTVMLRSVRKVILRAGSTSSATPLRVLFFGSDKFSVITLQALFNAQKSTPEKISQVELVCLPQATQKKAPLLPVKVFAKANGIRMHESPIANDDDGWQQWCNVCCSFRANYRMLGRLTLAWWFPLDGCCLECS